MKKKRYLVLVLLAIVIPTFLWFWTFPNTTILHNAYPFIVYCSQLFAIIGFSLFAFTFILSTRIKWIEKYFGGLDKLYQTHHDIGKLAFLMLLLHPVLLALRWLPDDIKKTLLYLLPFHRKMEINLGSWALLGLSILLLFTIVIKLPYDKWKITHKFMGLFFILGIVHVFGVSNFYNENPLLASYLVILSTLGLSAFLNKAIFHNWVVHKYAFKVEKIDKLDKNVMEITLRNESTEFNFTSGQFCFFQFVSDDLSLETHPFTICSTSTEGNISILVKSLGDYTKILHEKLTLNTSVLVEGPYGCFDYRLGNQKQIWIAGGVGIAPFVSWCRDLENNNLLDIEIDFYYCVNNKSEAFHLHEFEKLEKATPNFHVNLFCSDKTGFLKGSDIKEVNDKSLFICGPKAMRNGLLKDFKTLNVPKDNIIYEDFDFL